jgi:hypothetical protein
MWPGLIHNLQHVNSRSLLAIEVTKTKVRRQNVEQPDDADVEAKMSQMTNTWWCVLQAGTALLELPARGPSCGATPLPQASRRHGPIFLLHHTFECSCVLQHSFALWCCRCVSYPQMLDSLHLRLHRMREKLRKHLGDGEDVLVRGGPACCLPAACLL